MFPNTCWFIPSKNHAFWRSVILWTGEGWGRDDLCQPLWYLPKTKDLQSAVRIKFSGFTKPHQTLQFPVETIHSFVSFFGLPKISQDISRYLKIMVQWSNGQIVYQCLPVIFIHFDLPMTQQTDISTGWWFGTFFIFPYFSIYWE